MRYQVTQTTVFTAQGDTQQEIDDCYAVLKNGISPGIQQDTVTPNDADKLVTVVATRLNEYNP